LAQFVDAYSQRMNSYVHILRNAERERTGKQERVDRFSSSTSHRNEEWTDCASRESCEGIINRENSSSSSSTE